MDYRSILQPDHPMASARLVRRERYAWPGGYLLVLVLTDGALLCPDCVKENFGLISHSHRNWAIDDGWKPAGHGMIEEFEDEDFCGHCNANLREM